jgi:hypothetical protein
MKLCSNWYVHVNFILLCSSLFECDFVCLNEIRFLTNCVSGFINSIVGRGNKN